jgi:hypothetical protein
MTILKEEINQGVASILGLSKWKLVIIAVLAAVGLGLQNNITHFDHGYLLLFVVPLLCAYVDMLVYERSTAICVIAKHIREYTGDDKEMLDLKDYENFVERCRQGRLYLQYERFAQFAASVVLGIALPALALWARDDYATHIAAHRWVIVLPVLGLFAVVGLYLNNSHEIRKLKGREWHRFYLIFWPALVAAIASILALLFQAL